MADRMRWRMMDTHPMMVQVNAETVIELGDLLWLDGYEAKPAASYPWTTDAATTQIGFKRRFLGVAMLRSRSGETTPIRVATRGMFEFDFLPNTGTIGEYVCPSLSGDALENQILEKTDVDRAIARFARVYPDKTESVFVEIFSTVCTGGV